MRPSAAPVMLLLAALLLSGCSSGPAALGPADIPAPEYHVPEIDTLLEYYDMCHAAWKVRESYRDYPWQMQFFAHEDTNTLGFTMEHEGRFYIVFRGSQPFLNEIDQRINYQIARVRIEHLRDYGKLRAHYGFQQKYTAVRQELLQRVALSDETRASMSRPALPITVVGHSQGGAMASLTFLELSLRYPERDVRAVSFGMPRIYNRAAARLQEPFDHRHLRIVNGRDLVARLPFRSLGYYHVGTKLRVGRSGFPWVPSFLDHYPGYGTTLEAIQEERYARSLK